jgi:hypothetical protein
MDSDRVCRPPPEHTQVRRLNILSHAYGMPNPGLVLTHVEARVRESLRRQRIAAAKTGGSLRTNRPRWAAS